MSELWDDPNRQAVGLAPAGVGGGSAQPAPQRSVPLTLDEMSKEELLEVARERGVTPANAAMSKAEIRESIDNA